MTGPLADVADLTPSEFCRRWPEPQRQDDVVLLDVRETHEREQARLAESLHIPMRDVPGRIAELPRDKPIVVMCHHGGRSERIAQFLAANDFGQVFNLHGGIDAWSRTVDSTVPRY